MSFMSIIVKSSLSFYFDIFISKFYGNINIKILIDHSWSAILVRQLIKVKFWEIQEDEVDEEEEEKLIEQVKHLSGSDIIKKLESTLSEATHVLDLSLKNADDKMTIAAPILTSSNTLTKEKKTHHRPIQPQGHQTALLPTSVPPVVPKTLTNSKYLILLFIFD